MTTILLDNYDSFTFNLYQYLGELDEAPIVLRNDRVTLEELKRLRPDRIVISPGPGSPDDRAYVGVCPEAIVHFAPSIPVLGICLGHQSIIHSFGGRVVRAPSVMHGKSSLVSHDGDGIFEGVQTPFPAMRYHSLIADAASIPDTLKVIARTAEDETIMAVRHREYPLYGLQFHPESVGTPDGKLVLKNFVRMQSPR
jgi:anthranilate synthase component 2